MQPETVLILDGQAVQTLTVARCLHKSGYRVVLLCDGKSNYGYHTRYADDRHIGPHSNDEEAYKDCLFALLQQYKIDVIIPMTDDSARFASRYKADIMKHNTSVLIPDYDIFLQAYDKNRLMALCKKQGYPHPRTIDMSIVDYEQSEEVRSFPYPALLKPNFMTGGRGMTFIHNYEELLRCYPTIQAQYGDCHLQQFIQPGGRQVKVELFVDKQHLLQYGSVIHKQRYYPVNGGSSCCNITIDDPTIVRICALVLKDIGWIGFADFDLIEDPTTGSLLIMEINPRVPACLKSTYVSGLDYATMIADATLNKPLKKYTYSPGKQLRHLGFEILWFLKSPTRFHTSPCWFKFIGKNIYYQDLSWNDIIPFLCGTWGNIRKQLNPAFRKSKAGLDQ